MITAAQKRIKGAGSVMAAFAMLIAVAVPSNTVKADTIAANTSTEAYDSSIEYFSYYQKNKDMPRAETYTEIEATSHSAMKNPSSVSEIDGKNSVTISEQNDWCEWNITAEADAMYSFFLNYYPLEGTGKNILLSVMIDGEYQYSDAEDIELPRLWADKADENGITVKKDKDGNDLKPMQVEVKHWLKRPLQDTQGLYSEPYLFHLSPGNHTIRILYNREPFAISSLGFGKTKTPISYKEYQAEYSSKEYKGKKVLKIQAEQAAEKTSPVLYPVYDRTTSATEPNDAFNIRLNTIGQSNWANSGESISWNAPVTEPGLYKISFRARQSYNEGMNSYRTLTVNGEIPFAEAENISFPYDSDWYIKEFNYLVFLNPGDKVALECTSGAMSDVLRRIQLCVREMNSLYRNIITITGTSPDVYRDYSLESQIPGLSDTILGTAKTLKDISNDIKKLIGKSGSQASTIDRTIKIFNEIGNDTRTLTERFSSFKDNIESLGSLILTLQKQPLELDYILFSARDSQSPKADASFFENTVFQFKKFLASFVNSYNTEEPDGKNLKVWVSTGRDQMQILNNMVNDSFTVQTGINVNLSLVSTATTLIQATLAGKGPDAALMVGKDYPVNLAMRGALLDLSKYDLTELKSQTHESAWTSFYYNGGLYALPEAESFDMLFYRTDVFEQLGLEPPQTWQDFYYDIEILKSNNYDVGIPEVDESNLGVSLGISTFDKFLFQRGGKYYNDSMTKTEFETEESQSAFEDWVKLYKKLGLAREYNFFNRFRNGEMPMAIQNYNAYNQLMQSAPEIRGLWSFAMIPGTVRNDGSIDRSETASVTGCIVLNTAKKRGVADEAVAFIKWWTSADMQARFGQEIEATLGIGARYTPANMVAFKKIGWSKSEADVISAQWQWAVNPPQIPGNYTVNRSLTSAFRSAVNGKNSARRSLSIYNKDINSEISRKRDEFHLDK